MAVAYVSAGSRAGANNGTSVTPALPASLAVGDLMVTAILVEATSQTISTPSGWTQLGTTGATGITVAWYYRVYQSGDTAPSYSWATSASNGGLVMRFTGVDPTTSIGAKSTVSNGTTSTHTSNALTTTAANSMVILLDAVSVNTTLGTPSSWTLGINSGTGGSTTNNIAMMYQTVASSGASSGSTSVTGGSGAWGAQQIELLDYVLKPSFAVTEPKDTVVSRVDVFSEPSDIDIGISSTAISEADISGRLVNPVIASFAITEARDTASFALRAVHTAALSSAETIDTASVSATVAWTTSLTLAEASDTASFDILCELTASLSVTEATDTAAVYTTIGTTKSVVINATEAVDTASVGVDVGWNSSLSATEPFDSASFQLAWASPFTLAATEAPDTASILLIEGVYERAASFFLMFNS